MLTSFVSHSQAKTDYNRINTTLGLTRLYKPVNCANTGIFFYFFPPLLTVTALFLLLSYGS